MENLATTSPFATPPTSLEEGEEFRMAESLLIQGEKALLQGDLSGMELLDEAAAKAPKNPYFLYRQGLALFEYGSEEGREKALYLANRKFKAAIALAPAYFEVWQAWGSSLCHLGLTSNEQRYFLEAEEKFKTALSFSEHQKKELLSDLHWEHGIVWNQIALQSGEALDFQLALDAFQKAAACQDKLPAEFWNAFGGSALALAARINDIRLYVKAINCFKHAISMTVSSYEGWSNLAKALQMLYAHTHDEDHFSQANECFSAAAQLHPQDVTLWLNWSKFLCESGRYNQDIKRLRSCIEKCHRAIS